MILKKKIKKKLYFIWVLIKGHNLECSMNFDIQILSMNILV